MIEKGVLMACRDDAPPLLPAGMNKIAHLWSVHASGVRFEVLPGHYLLAMDHEHSPSWSATFGANKASLLSEKKRSYESSTVKWCF
jgi:hypothetical protein